jgi:hypothetical protein
LESNRILILQIQTRGFKIIKNDYVDHFFIVDNLYINTDLGLQVRQILAFTLSLILILSSSSNVLPARPANAVPENSVELDLNTYSWTDRVYITVIAPEYNLNRNQFDTIGTNGHGSVQVCTSKQCISYTLTENATDSGIFTGYVTLTGDPSLKGTIGVDGQGTNPSGITSQCSPVCGPTDGKLSAENSDYITVSFVGSDNQKVMANAQIVWYLGDVHWDKPNYSANDEAILEVTDYDMIINPDAIENLPVSVSSNGDPKGITVNLVETGPGTGVFDGTVKFSTNSPSSGNVLYVTSNDKVKAEYIDRTLPAPYSASDLLRISTTSNVSGYSSNGLSTAQQSGTTTTNDYTNYSLQQGEWVKYKMHLKVESNDNALQQRFQAAMIKSFSSPVGQQVNSIDDIEWVKTTISSVSTNNINTHNEAQILGKHIDIEDLSLDKSPITAIPTNLQVGDTFDSPFSSPNNPSKVTVTAIKDENLLGTSVNVYELTSSKTIPGIMTTQTDQTMHYDSKTGVLLDWILNLKFYNSTKFVNVEFDLVPIAWSQQPSASAQATISNTSPSFLDVKTNGCKIQFGSSFYYDSSQDKCMPPSGSWDNPGIDYYDNYCKVQYGSGFYYDSSQNACLPPSGSWQNPGVTYYGKQCEDQFWPEFYYDASQNACLPPSGSWQNFAEPQSGVTDHEGKVTFQIAGQPTPFRFVDETTGLPLSGLNIAFSLDPKTQSVGALWVLDPTSHYHLQFIALIPSGATSNSNTPTSWKNYFIPNAYAQTPKQILIHVSSDPRTLATLAVVLASGGLAAPIADVGNLLYDAAEWAAKKADKNGWLPITDFLLKHGYRSETISFDKAKEEINLESTAGVVRTGATLLGGVMQGGVGALINPSELASTGAGIGITGATNILDTSIISSCDPNTKNIRWIQVMFTRIYSCESKIPYGLFKYEPPGERQHVSIELLSKTNRGFYEKIQADTDQLIPVPTGDYKMTLTVPDHQPTTINVTVNPGQITKVDQVLQPIPSNSVVTEPLAIQTSGGTCTVNQYCDILIASATGGLAPYHFQSDTFANGTPPFGMTIGIYGHLTGTPTQAQPYTFGVCVVDTAGKSSCGTVTVTVNPAPTPPAPTPPAPTPSPTAFRSCMMGRCLEYLDY